MKKIKIIEVKSEIGAGTRGASLGVEAMKIASLDLKSNFFRKYGSIEVENINELLFDDSEYTYAKFVDCVLMMEERVCLEVYEQLFDDFFPLVMAGDHSTAYGTIAGIKKAYPKKRLGVIWIDAHADLNTPFTTPSGYMQSMPMAMTLGLDNLERKVNDPRGATLDYWEQMKNVGIPGPKIHSEDLVYIGVRDLQKAENYYLNKYNINFIEVEEVRKKGATEMAKRALTMLNHCDLIYVSFDVDSIDSKFSIGTGTPVADGLTVEEAKTLSAELCADPRVCAYEIAEVNPTLDTENRMAEIAFEILEASAKAIEARLVLAE